MKRVYDELCKIEVLEGKTTINEEQDHIVVTFHEYMRLDICHDLILLNGGLTHWHGDDEDIIESIMGDINGEDIYIEWRDFFHRPLYYFDTPLGKSGCRICDSALKILSAERFEKKKAKYLRKKHLRIYSGNEIIKRSAK